MYIPKHFQINDVSEAVSFMQHYSFATLINIKNGVPAATHLPFVVTQNGDDIILSSHLAKPNPQSADMFEGTSLVIFTEPHAYVAPKHYEKELNVPTWNYIAIHAYGNARIITNEEEQLLSLEQMISSYDADYLKQWAGLPMEFKLKMIKGITVFDILVTDLQGKSKLSQNRTQTDRSSIINAFTRSTYTNEQQIGEYMRREMEK